MAESTEERIRFLRRLRAIKEFTPVPIPGEVIRDILEVGRWAGSGANRQPTEVVVVRDPEVRRKFGEWGARPAASAPLVLLLVTSTEAGAFDEGRMAERLLLAAAVHGLGSTVATLKNEGPEEAKKLLGIPEERRVRTVVAIGYPDWEARRALPKNPQAGRKPLSEYAHWDHF